MTLLAVVLALVAAALLAVGSVAQRSAAGAVPDEQARAERVGRGRADRAVRRGRGPAAVGVTGAAVLGTLLQQAAFQAGTLAASLPAITVGEPVVAVALGLTVLSEQVRADGAEWALIGALVVATVVATVALARSTASSPADRVVVGT